MRNAFAQEITKLAGERDEIVLLSGDIGNRLFDKYKEAASDRFYNCGVAEANMIGMAAGLAMKGLRPICYTIAPFITYRCMEQIRIDLCYHEQPVLVVGTGSGLAYASLGTTHHSCEEMGMLRLLPTMTVLAPADANEVRALLNASLKLKGPAYMRIGKKGEAEVHDSVPNLEIGKSIQMKDGSDVCLLNTGTTLSRVLEAAEQLEAKGISAAVQHFPTVKPLDKVFVDEASEKYKLLASIEEHSVLGGFGGSIAEHLAEKAAHPRLLRFGAADEFLHETSEQETAMEHYGLTAGQIADRVAGVL
ncbi:MAG: transketolase family protein [Limisphaerales bacterium]